MKKESDIQNEILEYLSFRQGVVAWRNNNIPVYDPYKSVYRRQPKWTPKGLPDILGILEGGIMLGIEVKTPNGKLSKDQEYILNKFKSQGGVAIKATCIEDVKIELDQYFSYLENLRKSYPEIKQYKDVSNENIHNKSSSS